MITFSIFIWWDTRNSKSIWCCMHTRQLFIQKYWL